MKTLRYFGLLLFAAILAAFADHAGELSIQLPAETAAFKTAPGVELAMGNCLVCHSAEYIQYQPPMPRKFWETEVKKMQAKYGAPLPDDKVASLVDYLTAAYGVPEKGNP